MKKDRSSRIQISLMVLSMVIFGAFLLIVNYYYQTIMSEAEVPETDMSRVYSYQYELIVDSRNSAFWQEVYRNARAEAAEHDALLSMRRVEWNQGYEKADYVDMCIAEKADGIILEYNGESGLIDKINEAVERGIPVVTIINDPNTSSRQSFVGVNDYQLGNAYGTQVANLVTEQTRSVMILSNREQELEKNQMYGQIYNAVYEQVGEKSPVRVREQNLLSRNPFDVEEAIRNLFQSEDEAPDILVCLDEITTECAYQAMLDFNMVGEVSIVGFYATDMILDAVKKGLIPVTLYMDAEQIGLYSIEALTEYWEVGRSNSYYTVDLKSITTEDLNGDGEGAGGHG